MNATRISFTSEELDDLDDAVAYYKMCHRQFGDPHYVVAQRAPVLAKLQDKIELARMRVQ